MTVNLLAVYGLFSLYLYIGSFHEEHRLIKQFGSAYRAYQERVGRFLPRRIPTVHQQPPETETQ
jgi:protein-S-isoprenylcysteine O-methyltransferase Ste14